MLKVSRFQIFYSDHLRLLVQTTKYDPESETKTWWLESEDSAGDRNSWSGEDREKARINHLMAVMEEYLKKIVVPPPPIVSKQQVLDVHSCTSRIFFKIQFYSAFVHSFPVFCSSVEVWTRETSRFSGRHSQRTCYPTT